MKLDTAIAAFKAETSASNEGLIMAISACDGNDIEILLMTIRKDIESLATSQLMAIYPEQVSTSAKTPYKLAVFREGLCWRFEELARCSADHYATSDLAVAITLTRAAMECAAAVCYLFVVSRSFVQGGTLEALDQISERLLVGSKSNPDMPEAINVLTMLSKADMEISGIERCYKALSEYAHPNWSGTAFIYSQHHTDALYTSFGRNERNSMALAGTGINALQAALKLFQYGFNGFSDCFEDLVKKCEQHLDKSK